MEIRARRMGGMAALTLVLAGLLAATLAPTSGRAAASAPTPPTRDGFVVHRSADGTVADVNVCSLVVAVGYARCLARRRTDVAATSARPRPLGQVTAAGQLGGDGAYGPSSLQSAYNVPAAAGGAGVTVAIVDAFDDPNATADLAFYRQFYRLPACPMTTGCFTKVDQTGGASFPPANSGWAQEISLDLDMVSATCPLCKILLLEANSASLADLGTSVNTAVRLGASVVSNSYGGPEYASETADDALYFNHPGVAIVASAGDRGYGVSFPAASASVTAVGGTTLFQSTATGARNAKESAWRGTGSGCSAYEPKPQWQTDAGCPNRTVADVSAVADPATGVWVYDTYGGGTGFGIFGGTSVAAPIVGSVYAVAGASSASGRANAYPYANPGSLNDIIEGSNGTCSPRYLCVAGTGYDGPTGLGTPNGTAALSELSLTATSNPVGPSYFLTYGAQIGDPGASGVVTFAVNGSMLSKCTNIPLDSQGGAFCTGNYPVDGTYSVTATFSGSPANLTASLVQVVSGSQPIPVDLARR